MTKRSIIFEGGYLRSNLGHGVEGTLSAANKKHCWMSGRLDCGFVSLANNSRAPNQAPKYHAPAWARIIIWHDLEIRMHWPVVITSKIFARDKTVFFLINQKWR